MFGYLFHRFIFCRYTLLIKTIAEIVKLPNFFYPLLRTLFKMKHIFQNSWNTCLIFFYSIVFLQFNALILSGCRDITRYSRIFYSSPPSVEGGGIIKDPILVHTYIVSSIFSPILNFLGLVWFFSSLGCALIIIQLEQTILYIFRELQRMPI